MNRRDDQITPEDIEELIAFDDVFYSRDFNPVERTGGGDRDSNGIIEMPYPIYKEEVTRFKRIISSDKWCDYDYQLLEQQKLIESPSLIDQADLTDIRSLLTYVQRGERFCDGHIASMITSGIVKRIFDRLRTILNEFDCE